jgi:hypothetical protein
VASQDALWHTLAKNDCCYRNALAIEHGLVVLGNEFIINVKCSLPVAISNEKFRCQEKLFSHRGFDCAGRQAESLYAGQGLKMYKTQPEFVKAFYHIVIIIKIWQSHYRRLN